MLYIIIIIGIVALEAILKGHMDKSIESGDRKPILGGKIILKKHYNQGMFLNFMEDKRELVIKLSGILLGILLLVFTFLLPRKHRKLFKLGLSLCLGGAISNVYDRFNKGHVVDYFSFNCRFLKSIIFNLADIFIFLGSFIMLIASLFSSDCNNVKDAFK